MLAGKRRELAKALSTVENRAAGWREILSRSFRTANDAVVIGVTGPAGSGKSTLVDGLTAHWASDGQEVAVLAVDPSSPFSGGAVLGDRVRMQRSENLDNVFIRSVSARGNPGGLNEAAIDFTAVVSAFGVKRILLETVGAGQSETDIGFAADCVIVVAVPGLGDAVQASKAGLMEIGDIYVVNKNDVPGADMVVRDLTDMTSLMFAGKPCRNWDNGDLSTTRKGREGRNLAFAHADSRPAADTWRPPVVATCATDQRTIGALAETIDSFLLWAAETEAGAARKTRRADMQLRQIIQRRTFEKLAKSAASDQRKSVGYWAEQVARHAADPYSAADILFGAADGASTDVESGEDRNGS